MAGVREGGTRRSKQDERRSEASKDHSKCPSVRSDPAVRYDRLAAAEASPLQRKLTKDIERHFGPLAQGLRGEPHRGVDGAEPLVVAPLHDFEKEAAIERLGIGVEELARSGAVIEDRRARIARSDRRQVVLRGEPFVVGLRNIEQRHIVRAHRRHGGEDVAARDRDVVNAAAAIGREQARCRGAWAAPALSGNRMLRSCSRPRGSGSVRKDRPARAPARPRIRTPICRTAPCRRAFRAASPARRDRSS